MYGAMERLEKAQKESDIVKGDEWEVYLMPSLKTNYLYQYVYKYNMLFHSK